MTGEVQNTMVEAMKSGTCVYAGDLGSECFTDFTNHSFGSVQTSNLSMQRDQTYTDGWRSEVSEHKVHLTGFISGGVKGYFPLGSIWPLLNLATLHYLTVPVV